MSGFQHLPDGYRPIVALTEADAAAGRLLISPSDFHAGPNEGERRLLDDELDGLVGLGASDALGGVLFDQDVWYGQDDWQTQAGQGIDGIGGDCADGAKTVAVAQRQLSREVDGELHQFGTHHRFGDEAGLKAGFFHGVISLMKRAIQAAFGRGVQ